MYIISLSSVVGETSVQQKSVIPDACCMLDLLPPCISVPSAVFQSLKESLATAQQEPPTTVFLWM